MAKLKQITEGMKKTYLLVLVAVFVVIAILGYAFEPKEEPKRVAFDTKGGGVIFDHQVHVSLENVLCKECHHNFDDAEDNYSANCRGCHSREQCDDEAIHKKCIGRNCTGCHLEGSVNCNFCHNAEIFVSTKPPAKIEFDTDGGGVVFDHLTHASPDGYDLACDTCHHGYKPENKKSFPMNCRRCHYNTKYETICEDEETHARCVGKNCVDCHTDGAEDCEICHKE
ncbi:MAG: hypothetical protein JSV88_02670 [Candidatus Aminicenantes bacterium]|nr:MAG: hypothetical protein JSV88_02670 [Candidatus Aminicenantes bacterium]